MIIGSILLVLVAAGLLIAGLTRESDPLFNSDRLYYVSIVTSAVAAFVLIIGARKVASTDADEDDDLSPAGLVPPDGDLASPGGADPRPGTAGPVPDQSVAIGTASAEEPAWETGPRGDAETTRRARFVGRMRVHEQKLVAANGDEGDPPDEPAAQSVSPADAAIVARLSTPVHVINGRPRYHSADCLHLLGRDHETVAVAEAVELGFTPCGQCEPDRALIAEARRR